MRTLRSHLVALALLIALPLVALAVGLLVMLHRQTYATFEQGLLATTRVLTLAVDGELTSTIKSLEGLGATRELDTDNLAGFREEAMRVLEAHQAHGWLVVVLLRPDGRQVVNTGMPVGSLASYVAHTDSFTRVVKTREPAVGDFVLGPLTRRPNVAVRVPILRNGRLKYVLTATVSTSAFNRLLQEQRLPPGWRARVVDRHGVTVDASVKPEEVVGTQGGAAYLDAAARMSEGVVRNVAPDGVTVYGSFARSRLTGWVVGIGVPAPLVEASSRRSLLMLAATVVFVLLAALVLARLYARRLTRPITALATAADAVVAGTAAPPASRARIQEVEALQNALAVAGGARRRADEEGRRREEALQASEARLTLALDIAGLGTWDRDVRAGTARCSAQSFRILGIDAPPADGEIPVETWRECIHPEDRAAVLAAIREAEVRGTLYRVEHRVVRSPNDMAWVEGLGRFVYDGTGAAVRMAGVIRDVTERHRHEEERGRLLDRERRARADAESANRAKDEFLAMLGHELRNPLGAITNAIRVLERIGKPVELEARARGVIVRQTEHLKRLVDDLLDVGRVMTGKIVLSPQPLDLVPLVRRCLDTLGGAGRTVRHTIRLRGERAWVRADEVRIEQIVTNLVVNALKYTPAGGTIDISVAEQDGQGVLEVRDTGVGIPAELLPHVFDLFVQGERTLDRSQAGLGIGLTLVRRLADLHGGAVTAASDGANAGSTFTVRLPLVAPPLALVAPSPTDPAPTRRRIVLVEDNDESRDMLRCLLELDGHDVHEAADGATGVEIALRVRPDIALIDIGLPGIDGYEVARMIRAEAGETIMLVALTGYGSVEDRLRTRQAGFAAHLVKPLDPSAVKDLLAGTGWPQPTSESEDAAVQS